MPTPTTPNLRQMILNIPDGSALQLPYDQYSFNAVRANASRLNAEVGWKKYQVSVRRITNSLEIINNPTPTV